MKTGAIFFVIFFVSFLQIEAQKLLPFKLPDTGQTIKYSTISGEDADVIINPPSFTDNGYETITDNITGLMWQKTDGGEMTFEAAAIYVNSITVGGYTDWRLPTNQELFSINNYDSSNPALNTTYFTKTLAEYWWTSEVRADDITKVWVVNAGGGTGAHPKSETISAGGTKKFHVRAVRDPYSTVFTVPHFTDNGNGTITDNNTGLIWQKNQSPNTMTWDEALSYCKSFSLTDKTDWRLPNVKELQSLNDEKLFKPSINRTFFPNVISGNYWTSTSMKSPTTKAWDINVDYGIVSYNEKTTKENVLLVRGGLDNNDIGITDVLIQGGEFEMGDHFNFVDPSHPSDEYPVHKVKVNSFYCSKTETTNQQFLVFLNSALLKKEIEVKNNIVYLTGITDIICYTHEFASNYSIDFDGVEFAMADFRGNHPMVGMMWSGAVVFCNWLSLQNGLDVCYNLQTWSCDFTKNGYRLPTEAEWEYAARGGKQDPYLNYPNGNILDQKSTNLPNSGDPYESAGTAGYPLTTPVAFYDGKTHLKTEYNWPGSATGYQTNNGENGYGLFDMQGNVWEYLNDWYGQNYYSLSPYKNPKGPDSGFLMPDGKPYRGMRGGNWYNGLNIGGVSDGHSRVSNRNPSYYRGPQDPNHPYYHLGFRVVRNYFENPTGIIDFHENIFNGIKLYQNYPNPFSITTTICFFLPEPGNAELKIYNTTGQVVTNLMNENLNQGLHYCQWNSINYPGGIYSYSLEVKNQATIKKMVLIK